MWLSGIPKVVVEAYGSRVGFVHPSDGVIPLGPLGDIIPSKLAST